MKKLFAFSLVFALMVGLSISGFAITQPDTTNSNIIIKAPEGSQSGKPVVEVRLVRYGLRDPNSQPLASCTAVVWDQNSADGVTVTASTVSGQSTVAGILITTLLTADSNDATDLSRRNWGYIAVSGRVLVSSSAVIAAGDMLCTDGINYGCATIISDDATGGNAVVGTSIGVDQTADRWGILGVALEANTTGAVARIPIMVKTE